MKRIITITILFLWLAVFPAYADIFGPVDNLGDLLDVSISSPADTEVLTYDSATGKWKNAAGGGSGDVTAVGDVDSGAAFNGTAGTTLTFEGDAGTNKTFLYDAATDDDFELGDDLNIEDTTPHLRLTDTTASEDDFEIYADGNQLYITNVTDSKEYFNIDGSNLIQFYNQTGFVFPDGAPSDNQILKYDLSLGRLAWEADAGGGSESTTVSDTATINLTLTGADITADLLEAGAEAILDLQDMQGAVTDAQVPDNITITETDPTALLTAGTDNVKDTHIDWGTGAGQVNPADFADQDIGDITITTGAWAVEDSSHAHSAATITEADPTVDTDDEIIAIINASPSTTIKHEAGGLEADVSAYNGFVYITGGATSAKTPNAGTDVTADLEEEVTEGSLADSTILSADIKNGEIVVADTAITAGRSLTWSTNDMVADAELYTDFKGMTIETPTDADNFFAFEAPVALTITRVTGIVESATSAVLTWQECDAAGDNCVTIEAVTADVDGTISTAIDNAGIDAGDIIRLDVGTVTGTVGQAHSTITFTKDD